MSDVTKASGVLGARLRKMCPESFYSIHVSEHGTITVWHREAIPDKASKITEWSGFEVKHMVIQR